MEFIIFRARKFLRKQPCKHAPAADAKETVTLISVVFFPPDYFPSDSPQDEDNSLQRLRVGAARDELVREIVDRYVVPLEQTFLLRFRDVN